MVRLQLMLSTTVSSPVSSTTPTLLFSRFIAIPVAPEEKDISSLSIQLRRPVTVATPSDIREQNPNVLPVDIVKVCEQTMDSLTAKMDDSRHFILPGGTPIAAQMHFARVVCRQAERRLWTLNRIDEVTPLILQYINRLSDLFFVMARYDMWQQNWPEERWLDFAYKRTTIKG